jgi:flagellar motor component MotA
MWTLIILYTAVKAAAMTSVPGFETKADCEKVAVVMKADKAFKYVDTICVSKSY